MPSQGFDTSNHSHGVTPLSKFNIFYLSYTYSYYLIIMTDNKKLDSVRIRLTPEMRQFVDHKCKITGKTISEIFREYISKDMYKQNK